MGFPTAGSEARARLAAKIETEKQERARDLIRRLLDAYRSHPDREYAEAFFGSMLRERGIDPGKKDQK